MKFSRLIPVILALLGFIASPVLAAEPGTWVLKGGVGMVAPKSNNLTFTDGADTVHIKVDDATSLALTATYMFTENWGFEVLGAWPFEHDIKVSLSGEPGSAKIGSTKHLPPTFSGVYHFAPDATFQPYVGAGINWTTFFDTKLVPELAAEGLVDLDLDDSFGLAAVLGGDWMINDKMLFSVEARWMNIESDATLLADDGSSASIGTVKIDPWVYAIYLGYRF
jgi:outer membrane protein